MKNNLFITATNTDVGKTVVSSLICNKLLKNNKKVAYYKPIQTGSINNSSPDCDFLKNLFDNDNNFSVKSSYIFKKAASPHYASSLENVLINEEVIINDYSLLSKKNDYVIVEGAGGLLVPVNNEDFFIATIPKMLNLNVLLVANAGLGTLNNVLLNDFYCNKNNIKLKVIILVHDGKEPTDIELNNYETLKKITKNKNIYLIKSVKGVDTEKKIVGNFFETDFIEYNEIERWFI
ncbi:MAG TPA: dethiobiotin synthase [Spirochaetota bacterium]|nr:dethiobiotin synthase [Spirochaetota bacterium]